MDLRLSDEEAAIRDTGRRFVERELLPLEADVVAHERAGRPGLSQQELTALQQRARGFGYWGLATPVEFGGMGLSHVCQSLLHTEVARSLVPFRFGGDADNILFDADAAQQREYLLPTIAGERRSCFALTEPGAGSDVARITTRACRDGDGWVLTGEKTFITHGDTADFAIVIAVTDPDVGVHRGATAFLVDRASGWTSSVIETMGAARPAALHFDDVRVPDRNVLGEVGEGFTLAMRWIGKGRITVPSMAIGIAERALSMAIVQANTRETFGRPIGTNQAIQWMLADSEAELESARWLTLRAAWELDAGGDGRHLASMAKLTAATMVGRVVDRVMQVFGGMGYTTDLPIEKWYRDVRLFRIYEGTDEMQRLILARDLLRGHTTVGGWLR